MDPAYCQGSYDEVVGVAKRFNRSVYFQLLERHGALTNAVYRLSKLLLMLNSLNSAGLERRCLQSSPFRFSSFFVFFFCVTVAVNNQL